MLKKLIIEQFVIIERLELDLQTGLTIFTGETGAGKSILLDALGLILGDPPNPDAIRQGSPSSNIEGVFAPPANNPVWQFFIDNDMPPLSKTEFKVQRILRREGEDEIRVNNKGTTLEVLKKISTFLAEIHGQFANQTMLAPANQLHLLDLSGDFPKEFFTNVAEALRTVHRIKQELEDEKVFIATFKKDMPKIESLVNRLDQIGMKEGFIEEVEFEYAKLLTARETSEAFQSIISLLIAGNGVLMGLTGANRILLGNENLDPEKTADLAGYLNASLENARAAAAEMRRLSPEYDIDTSSLNRYEEILTILKNISIETKTGFDKLYEHYLELSEKLFRLRNGKDKILELEGALQKAKANYLHHAHILHEKRVEAGVALSQSITAELPPLKLMRAEFDVEVEEKVHNPWTELGIDEVTFKARMNPGMPFSPVADTASGGELARLILGLKVVLQRVQTIPTLVFDEVDTGIGGAAAAAVGERLAILAETTQVLVITHSPQVASRGDQHKHVSKATDGVTTTSVVRQLTLDERIEEVSRMLAGDTITPEAQAAAKSLINEAARAAEIRRQNPPPPPVVHALPDNGQEYVPEEDDASAQDAAAAEDPALPDADIANDEADYVQRSEGLN